MTDATGPWTNDPQWKAHDNERRGTSTSDEEAALRDIGRYVFGIEYPKDVTPKRRLTDGRILAVSSKVDTSRNG